MLKAKKEEEEEEKPRKFSENNAIVWNMTSLMSPFVRRIAANSPSRSIRIMSKNETARETACELARTIDGKQVLLSHSPTRNEQDCRGVVDAVDFHSNKVEVTISTDTPLLMWEDTDIWLFCEKPPEPPIAPPNCSEDRIEVARGDFRPEESLEPPDAFDDTILLEEPRKTSKENDEENVFSAIIGWKYLGGNFKRMRRKEGEKWKNVYLTEVRMTPLDESKSGLLEFVKKHTALRLSDDIDELGDVFVEVCGKSDEDAQKTISLGVTGFSRTDVNIPLAPDVTYYLRVDNNGEDDDQCSLSSEEDVLLGYHLEQNVDELCEKIGDLTVTDICAKTLFTVAHNVAFIRIAATTTAHKLFYFKKLQGTHVVVHSQGEPSTLLAVVSKVMKDAIILTVKGVPRKSSRLFLFSKQSILRISVAHDYEERLLQLPVPPLETLRRQLASADIDIRFASIFKKDRETAKPKTYVTFTSKNHDFQSIPVGTTVLLGKCWEMEGPLEKKAEFVFATRVNESLKTKDPSAVTFEIKFTKTLIKGAPEFVVSKAFYYLEFVSLETIEKDPDYCLYDARNKSFGEESILRSCTIDENENIFINPFRRKPFIAGPKKQMPSQKTPLLQFASQEERNNKAPLITQNHRKLGCVYVSKVLSLENGNPVVQLRTGYDHSGKKISVQPWELGSRILLTEGTDTKEKTIKMQGIVQDTYGELVELLVDKSPSSSQFLQHCVGSGALNTCYVAKR